MVILVLNYLGIYVYIRRNIDLKFCNDINIFI
jgi:hypothetical protein